MSGPASSVDDVPLSAVLPDGYAAVEGELRRLAQRMESHVPVAQTMRWHWYPEHRAKPAAPAAGTRLTVFQVAVTLFQEGSDTLELILDVGWSPDLTAKASLEAACQCSYENHGTHSVAGSTVQGPNGPALVRAFDAGIAMLIHVMQRGPFDPRHWRTKIGLMNATSGATESPPLVHPQPADSGEESVAGAGSDGRSALWQAVHSGRLDHARALADAGADPWQPMMGGWSPGRLALAGGIPDLFGPPPDGQALSAAETATAQEAERLKAAVSEPGYEGMSVCCVAGIDTAEAVRRLGATVIELDEAEVRQLSEDVESDAAELTLGITDVPGGCVVSQPWAYGASMPGVSKLLSEGTIAYALYDNPKSGPQGSSFRDGVTVGWDLSTGDGWSEPTDAAGDILLTHLYQDRPFAFCFAYAGVEPPDDRPLTGPPDLWVRLPRRDYWS